MAIKLIAKLLADFGLLVLIDYEILDGAFIGQQYYAWSPLLTAAFLLLAATLSVYASVTLTARCQPDPAV